MALKNLIPWQREIQKNENETSLISFQREMNRLFDDFFSGFESFPSMRSQDFFPTINLKEDNANFTVTAELPGMDEKDIEITISENTLQISGEKKDETQSEKANYHYIERKSGYFKRVIGLPADVQSDRAEAFFKNGVLEIKLPKSEKPENIKKIAIKKGDTK
ncbi:Hsp20/alpha crystallin family protein [candidate division WOR-3 bacterium]|nr:Hsp20/alpha crystallin family protein [candidate division WOR-3 bacterium]